MNAKPQLLILRAMAALAIFAVLWHLFALLGDEPTVQSFGFLVLACAVMVVVSGIYLYKLALYHVGLLMEPKTGIGSTSTARAPDHCSDKAHRQHLELTAMHSIAERMAISPKSTGENIRQAIDLMIGVGQSVATEANNPAIQAAMERLRELTLKAEAAIKALQESQDAASTAKTAFQIRAGITPVSQETATAILAEAAKCTCGPNAGCSNCPRHKGKKAERESLWTWTLGSREAEAGAPLHQRAALTHAQALDVIRQMHDALLGFRHPEFDLIAPGKEGEFDDRVKAVLAFSAKVINADRLAAAFEAGKSDFGLQSAQKRDHYTDEEHQAWTDGWNYAAEHNGPAGPDSIEAMIQAKGKVAPRVTPADIEANIADETYFTAAEGRHGHSHKKHGFDYETEADGPLHLLTFCVLTLRNGFTVTGESACASPENFDPEIGRKIARENAVNKIWPLMGYELRSQLAKLVLTEADAIADLQGARSPDNHVN